MGFTSFTCAKSHLPIMAGTSWTGSDEMCDVVALSPDGAKIEGRYDGYGGIDGRTLDIDDLIAYRVKFVLKKYYTGETYEQLAKSGNELGQGHFHDEEWIEKLYRAGPLNSYQAYVDAYNAKYCPRQKPRI